MDTTTSPVVLPALSWVPSPNHYPGPATREVHRVVLHRWASPLGSPAQTKIHYQGVIHEFQGESSQVSAHLVFPGSGDPGKATQMVAWKDSAWTEAAYNTTSVEIESADNIWFGADPVGMDVLARIVGYLLKKYKLPAVYSAERGFCRHADLGSAGGGHTQCPTTDMAVWGHFTSLVQAQYKRGGYRPLDAWGK